MSMPTHCEGVKRRWEEVEVLQEDLQNGLDCSSGLQNHMDEPEPGSSPTAVAGVTSGSKQKRGRVYFLF